MAVFRFTGRALAAPDVLLCGLSEQKACLTAFSVIGLRLGMTEQDVARAVV